MVGVDGVDLLDDLALIFRRAQPVANKDSADDQHVAVQFDFASHFRDQLTVAGINLTRFQRAPEGAGQSSSRGGHHVIERGGARRVSLRGNLVMFGNLRVHSEHHRSLLRGQIGQAHGPALPLDANSRNIGDFSVISHSDLR